YQYWCEECARALIIKGDPIETYRELEGEPIYAGARQPTSRASATVHALTREKTSTRGTAAAALSAKRLNCATSRDWR
ncbi:hypothetical protein ACWCOW_41970, partial [Streptomyces sp. NPDC001939]